MLNSILYILLAIVILGVIIVCHEFGHFIVGRLCGIGVVEFSVGFGPKILGWKHKGTQFSLRAIPLGGFCKFVGEDESNSAPDAMNNASVWKRILTVFAGPAMNFVLAFLTGIVVLCMFSTADVYPEIRQVVDASAAQEAGLLPGDEITAVNGAAIAHNASGTQALREAVQTGETIALTVSRGGETLSIDVSPKAIQAEDGAQAYQLGVTFATRNYGFFEAIPASGKMMANVTEQLFTTLKNLIFHGTGADEMTGTVGTVVGDQRGRSARQQHDLGYYLPDFAESGHHESSADSGAGRRTAGVFDCRSDSQKACAAGEGGHGASDRLCAVSDSVRGAHMARYNEHSQYH